MFRAPVNARAVRMEAGMFSEKIALRVEPPMPGRRENEPVGIRNNRKGIKYEVCR